MQKAIFISAGILSIAAIPFLGGTDSEVDHKELVVSSQYGELETFLGEYRRSWLPDRKRALLKIARTKRKAFAPGLAYVLGERDHPARDVALTLTAELKLIRLRPLVRRIAYEGLYRLRPRAIIVAHQLEPWTDDEVMRFLDSKDSKVVIAGLALPNQKPWSKLLDLFGSEDASIARASLQALPVSLSEKQDQDLLALAMSGEECKRLCVLKALSRYAIEGPVESTLVRIATSGDDKLQKQALLTLAQKGSRLEMPEQIYWIVINSSAELEIKALALYCLEKTDSFDADVIAHDARLMPSLLRYHIARCLIQRNDRRGVDLLFGILADASSRKREVEPRELAATRQLLGRLSGMGVGAATEDWMRWTSHMGDLSNTHLPGPPLLDA